MSRFRYVTACLLWLAHRTHILRTSTYLPHKYAHIHAVSGLQNGSARGPGLFKRPSWSEPEEDVEQDQSGRREPSRQQQRAQKASRTRARRIDRPNDLDVAVEAGEWKMKSYARRRGMTRFDGMVELDKVAVCVECWTVHVCMYVRSMYNHGGVGGCKVVFKAPSRLFQCWFDAERRDSQGPRPPCLSKRALSTCISKDDYMKGGHRDGLLSDFNRTYIQVHQMCRMSYHSMETCWNGYRVTAAAPGQGDFPCLDLLPM